VSEEARRAELAEKLTAACWERLRETWGGPSFDRTWESLTEETRDEIRGFFAPLREEVTRG
jgi:ribosomal protein S18 acetylase RimI-like enzyme